jgi:hypothetical protein
LARQKVIEFLGYCHTGHWYGVDELIQAVKASQPDFQRPDGDYTTWYIHDLYGEPLMGFDHWDEVEGALLRYLISGPLHWLGILDLGYDKKRERPIAFRLADSGLVLLRSVRPSGEGAPHATGQGREESNQKTEDTLQTASHSPEASRAPDDTSKSDQPLIVQSDYLVKAARDASLYTRFQLARFAEFVGRETDYLNYRISPAGLVRARRQGITREQIAAFLARHTRGAVPARVLEGLRTWYERSGSVRLEQGILLRVDRPETLQALRKHPEISRLLGEVLGPLTVLVPRSNVEQVRRWLFKQGYLENL